MRIPLTFVVFRLVAVIATVLVLLVLAMGLTGRGPLHVLGGATSYVVNWVRVNTGVGRG